MADLNRIAQDVAYIRGRIENWDDQFEDHENRLRKIERRLWGIPASLVAVLLAAFGIHSA